MKVLLVDDNEEVSGLLRLSLGEALIDTVTVSDGTAALQQMEDNDFDALVIDSVLTSDDSIALVQKIRLHKSGKSVPILMMSTIGTSLARRMATSAGCDAFLVKPFGMMQLVESLKTLQRK
jgi:two-component system OmpR family response regulator